MATSLKTLALISVICGLVLAGSTYFIIPNLVLMVIVGVLGIAGLFVIGLVLSTIA
jgi:hypothetical protein